MTRRHSLGAVGTRGALVAVDGTDLRAMAPRTVGDAMSLRGLLDAAHGLAPIRMAIVHPCDTASLMGAIHAWDEGLIEPVLVGPAARIRAVAAEAGLALDAFEVVDVRHSHAAAETAVALARAGKVQALMKGALHTDEIMQAAVRREGGLRTGRRMSHVYALDVPHHPKPVFITDAAVNIAPSLDDKRDIVQNAIELCHALGIPQPKVAILSAVETVDARIVSTVDAAALCKMAERGQITGGIVDGPLALDNAVSGPAAAAKHIVSRVAGDADVLVVPDLVSGNMLAKQLVHLAGAEAAGLVLGATVPIVVTSRSDGEASRVASCAMARLVAHHRRTRPGAVHRFADGP
ncbi:bifunctional enoyl-CoA hydratase/phosphate acetyltransferase [Methylobacterium sp. WCS2018Hpa-22]|uniref:bifunctional enoyl-CoA hydratase/phosphate acetyltransferase n=1 Tax=Methylobacterium sp. WCS2018Hpa-22 TaxID=3073633 RepID=UPI00288BB66C|nr:bifunctional enoyl-CoA hydratase/phosphate acetyltransferase [Methylobacterium sp. WCS2018Hpa-22]